jgi:integrase/recombinase XerC
LDEDGGSLWPHIVSYVTGRVRREEIVKATAAGYWSGLSVLDKAHGNRPVRHAGEATVERWLELRAGLVPSSKRTQWSYLSKFFDYLVSERLIRENPCRGMDAPKRPRTVPRSLDLDAIDRLLQVVPDARAAAIVWLERGAGLRRIEVHRANAEDWSRRDKILRIPAGKGGHGRNVPVTAAVAAALDAYLREHPATVGPLIRSYTNGARLGESTLSHLMSDWMYAAGIKHGARDGVSGHALRHTVATEVADEVGDLRYVMQLLGHAHLSSTQVYVGVTPLPALRDAMEQSSTRKVVEVATFGNAS